MEVPTGVGFRKQPYWLLILSLLLVGQGWLSLRLFGTWENALIRLGDDSPLIDGRHPLHYYHGSIGNKKFLEKRTTSCYDPAYQAGYLKTPIFDSGCRPAELAFLLGGRGHAIYKLSVFVYCLLTPVAFTLAGRGSGLNAAGSVLAGMLGTVMFWSEPAQVLLLKGHLDLLLAGLCAPVFLGWTAAFGRTPRPACWLMMTFAGALGWYFSPLVMLCLLPIFFLYQFWVFTKHCWIWHLAMLASAGTAVIVNHSWLQEWWEHISIYAPFGGETEPPSKWPSALREWDAFLPSDPVDLGLGVIGLVGLMIMLGKHARHAWLFALGTLTFATAGAMGRLWPLAYELGTQKLSLVCVWCLAIPAAYALAVLAINIGQGTGYRFLGFVWLLAGAIVITLGFDLHIRLGQYHPFTIGLGSEREHLVQAIREHAPKNGRVLWEDRTQTHKDFGWTSLLSDLTDRHFLGGLAPDGCIDNMFVRLVDGRLAGMPIGRVSDEELSRFFHRYNITLIVAWTAESQARLSQHPLVHKVMDVSDQGNGILFRVERPPRFFLSGKGEVLQADWQRLALGELEPDEHGEVIISWHYDPNFRVSPSYVRIEKDLDKNDPVPLLRLKLPGPVVRVTLTWNNP
jgi:hypothetical protein